MIPKIHKKGSGFGGITKYVLHDKNADTTDRVAWTQTVNLGTRNPETASRVMMATSMDQDRLKREAGIKATGRKSKDHVLHVTLSWHADEAVDLTKDEQVRAAKWFLKEIKAGDRQALIVSHNDEPQPHVHLVVNRVSPKDGRILPSSFERLNASKWAEKYERDRGEILCHNRAVNNAARERGEYVRGEKEQPRRIFEQQQRVANDNRKRAAVLAEQRRKAAAIAKQQRATKERHRKEWRAMEQAAKKRRAEMQQRAKTDVAKARQKQRDAFRKKWEEHHHTQLAEKTVFDRNEKTLRGRMENAMKLVRWRDLVGKGSEGKRISTLAGAFRVFSSEGSRREALNKQLKQQEARLKKQQREAESSAVAEVKAQLPTKLAAARETYRQERSAVILKHRMETAKVKAQWNQHQKRYDRAWEDLRKENPNREQTTQNEQRAEQINAFEQRAMRRRQAANQNRRKRGGRER